MNQLTVGLALRPAAQGIRVNAVLPGLLNTPLIHHQIAGQHASTEERIAARDALSPTGKMGAARDVAQAALFLASGKTSYVNGVCLPVNGGLHAKVG